MATIDIDVSEPGQMVSAFGSLWVQSRAGGMVWRVDPDGHVAARIPDASTTQAEPRFRARSAAIAAGFGSVWSLTSDALVRIDPATNKVVGHVAASFPYALAIGEGAVWVVSGPGQVTLLRVDPATMHADVVTHLGTSVGAIAVSEGSVWAVRFSEGGGMDRIDPTTGAVEELQVGYNQRFLVSTPRSLWLINNGSVQRIDPTDGTAIDKHATKKADGSIGVSYAHGTVWINSGTAVGVDARSGAVTRHISAFTGIKWWWTGGIAQIGHRVWLVDPANERVIGVPINV